MARRLLLVFALAVLCTGVANAQTELKHGKLRVNHAGRGTIDRSSGSASFKLTGLDLLPADDSDGINPATETVTIGISEERFLIPAGQLKVSRNGKRFRYKAKTDRGVQLLDMRKRPDGSFRVSLKLAGVDLSSLVVSQPPLCLPFAVIIGNDDGFSGVSFDLPNPYPSPRLSIPGFCTDAASWPWV
jgi:hypothetical protein